MKRVLIIIILALSGLHGYSIGYFKIKFSSVVQGVKTNYTGLLLYYNDTDSLNKMRVYFNNLNGERVLAEETVKVVYDSTYGEKYRILKGYNARILINGGDELINYFPDNFKFIKGADGFFKPSYQESFIDEVGNVRGKIKSFEAVDNINAKELKLFGWGDLAINNSKTTGFINLDNIKSGNDIISSERFGTLSGPRNDMGFDPGNESDPSSVANSKVNIVIVSNTLDDELKESCIKDELEIERFFSSLVIRGGRIPVVLKINGLDFNKINVNEKLNNLAVNENDGIIFYFSGHGFRTSDSRDSFPFLDLRNNVLVQEPAASNCQSVREIFDLLNAKHAKFNIVFSECCNNDIGIKTSDLLSNNPPESLKPAGVPRNTIIAALAQSLLSFQGSILVSTAHPDQKSYYFPDKGGVFWTKLQQVMLTKLLEGDPNGPISWLDLISIATFNTNHYLQSQSPPFTEVALWHSPQ